MISVRDDAIVVDMDWDRFMAEGEELEQRLRNVVLDIDRRKAAAQEERSRQPARTDAGHSVARERPPTDGLGGIHERLDGFEQTLANIDRELSHVRRDVGLLQRDVGQVQRDVVDIRERMATKVELEAVAENVKIVADGFAQTQQRLGEVASLLKRYLTA